MSPAKKAAPKKATAKNPAAKKPAAKKPVATKTAVKAPKPKVPIALVRQLEAALARDGVLEQCAALANTLDEAAQPAVAAAAVLAHTRKGSPVARAYLNVCASSDPHAADDVVRYCATMDRGRDAMRDAFVASWEVATDPQAIEAAYANFSKALVGDPGILAAGVASATHLGDAANVADRTARLARATRLAPLLAELAGGSPARARGNKQLATLDAADRTHVYARVANSPRSFDEELARTAVLALGDDPNISDMTLAATVVAMQYHGQDELIAAWSKRVAAGDVALITRLLGLFEWTSLWATDDDHLEPYIKALWPASSRAEVFAHVEHAMASPNVVVRESILQHWLDEEDGWRGFTDAQIDKLMRSAVAIAEAGGDGDDISAADHAIFGIEHPGARHALMDAVRHASTKKNDELRENSYSGLSHIDHPDVLPFLVERMFVEREDYYELCEAISDKLSGSAAGVAGHRATLATLAARAGDPDAIHAACVYTDVFVHKDAASPRLLVELGRAVLAWQATKNDDARRLRHIFEQATVAALDIRSPDDARAFVARAKALPASPYSDYSVKDRDEKTPAPFADAEVKKRLAALEAGKLDKQIADARAAAEAARAAGKPLAVTDDQLGALAGCTVASRFFDDRERKVVWFYDEVGELHVYDGYAVMPMVLEVAGVEGKSLEGYGNEVAAFLAGQAIIDERVTLLDAKGTSVREILRVGTRLLVFDGRGLDYWEHIGVEPVGLRFASYTVAREAVARFAANPPDGMKRVDSWYIEGKGALRRKYYAPKPGGGYNSDGDIRLAVLGARIDGWFDTNVPDLQPRDHPTPEAAIAAMQAYEGKLFALGGRITQMWIDTEATRREDTVLSAFLEERYRTDTEDAVWHAHACKDMLAAIDNAGLRALVPDIVVTEGPPATEAEIAAYQALVPEPLPEPLVAVWRAVGGVRFTTASTTGAFLSPAELVAKRDALRGELRTWAQKHLKGSKQKRVLADADHLDTIALVDGAPVTLFDTAQRQDDHRCFTGPDSGWWEKALGWQFATDLNCVLKAELERRVGDIYRLKLGQRAGTTTQRTRLAKAGGNEYEAIVDGTQTMTRTLTAKSPGKPSVKTHTTAEAATKFYTDAIAAAKKKGFK